MVADKKNPTQLASVDRLVVGEVVSDKMEKTVVVKVVRTFKHAVYGKVVRRHKKFKVHDENNTASLVMLLRSESAGRFLSLST